MDLIKIDYAAYFKFSGFIVAAQSYIQALHQTGECDIKITIFGENMKRNVISDEKYEFFMGMAKKEEDPERILIYHCIPTLQRRVKKNKKSIGFATFETFSPPKKWIDLLNENDAILAISQFNYKIFSHEKIKKPIYYIPHCLDFDVYNKKVFPMYDYDKYTFLFLGTFKERKGYKELFEAWIREFTEADNVQLVIKTDRPQKAEQYLENTIKQLGINKGIAPVIFENKVFDEKIMPSFIKSADCFICPTKGEGFGIPGLQCQALDIPVIITNFSGCQDYATERTATLLEPSGFILRNNMDNIPQFKNKKWAFIEVGKIRKAMRYVINNKDEVKVKAGVARNYVSNRFNYDEVGKLFVNMLREING